MNFLNDQQTNDRTKEISTLIVQSYFILNSTFYASRKIRHYRLLGFDLPVAEIP